MLKRSLLAVFLSLCVAAAFSPLAVDSQQPTPYSEQKTPPKESPKVVDLPKQQLVALNEEQPAKARHGRGHKGPTPEQSAKLHAMSNALHGAKLASLPKATAATYDCRTLGIVPPIVDQGQCGSCWCFSGTSICTSAFMKALGTNAPGPLSEQYTLDCGQNGGCNGDDNTTVTAWALATGLPTTAAYGPYEGSAGKCKSAGITLYKISGWGYCSSGNNQSVSATQDIKNAMVAYGPIGCGIDASGSSFDNYTTGVISGTGSNIDHDIVLVGWDDTKGTAGCWILRNSWGTTWGIQGYAYIEYGAFSVGWEAIWAQAPGSPPPSPTPIPPGPTPVPPGPTPAPPTSINQMTFTGPAFVGGTVTLEGMPAGSTVAYFQADAAWQNAKTIITGGLMPPAPSPVPNPTPNEVAILKALSDMQTRQATVDADIAAKLKAINDVLKIGQK